MLDYAKLWWNGAEDAVSEYFTINIDNYTKFTNFHRF